MMHIKWIIIPLACGSLAACSNPAKNIEDAVSQSKCDAASITQDKNLFNGRSAKCRDGSRLYWFPTKEANETHGKGCRSFGGLPVESGSNWTRYLPSC